MFYSTTDEKSLTVIFVSGYDGAQEVMLPVCGFAVLEWGWNALPMRSGASHPL